MTKVVSYYVVVLQVDVKQHFLQILSSNSNVKLTDLDFSVCHDLKNKNTFNIKVTETQSLLEERKVGEERNEEVNEISTKQIERYGIETGQHPNYIRYKELKM